MVTMPISTQLSKFALLLFCLPAIIQSFMHGPAGAMLQGVYGTHLGLSLTSLGIAIAVTRIFDAVTDPLIGFLSDKTREKTGSRKPWVIAGTAISVVSVWFLYNPGETTTIWYFGVWFMLAYLGWTMVEIPYRSWGLTLSSDYSERTLIMTVLAMATTLGGIAFFFVPMIQQALGMAETSEITPVTLAGTAIVVAIGLPLATALAVWKVPEGVEPDTRHAEADSFRLLLKSITGNGPLIYITLIFLAMGLSSGMGAGLMYFYVAGYLGLGEQLAMLLVLGGPVVLLSTPLWGWVCTRVQKHRALAVSVGINALVALGLAFVPTGGEGMALFAPLLILSLCTQAAGVVAFPAIMGDVADYGRLKFGHDRTGTYFAFFTLVQKAVGGLGAGLGLVVAGMFGFDATAAVQSESGAFGMKLCMAYIPFAAAFFVAPLIWRFPIDKATQQQISADLAARDAAS